MIDYYISKDIKAMLDKAKKAVKEKDWDRVYIIDGMEGTGKSLLGLQLGCYLDPTLNLDRIVFDGESFAKAITKAEKNQCIIFDEAFNGLSSAGSLSKLNRLIVRKLMECRQKNLFVIIILPTIFLLQKYAAIFRSKALFHVYAARDGTRGYYKSYNYANKKLLYLQGSKMYSYQTPFIHISHIFRGKYPIDEEMYRRKKLQAMEDQEEREEDSRQIKQRDALIHYLRYEMKIKLRDIQTIFEDHKCLLKESAIGKIARKTNENRKKESDKYI